MIVKMNENNVGSYGTFLAKAYQYLELLEWHRAYQFLLKKNISIDEVDLDTYNILDSDKTFFSRAAFQKYEYDNEGKKRYDDTVYIIMAEDRDDKYHAFSTIEQYFNYIEIIKKSNRADHFLLSLPLDEGILEINANTRSITIPDSFVSTVIQKDAYAETVVFSIDRFIDNIDLASNDFEIYVQWSGLDNDGNLREEASVVQLKDLENGKIKFGWILSEEVTKYPGNINFSVVFFKREGNEVKFRLNTLPSSLIIQPALQTEIKSQSEAIDAATNLFNIIRNNKYPGKGIEAPKDPTFVNGRGGFDLEDNDPIEKENERLQFKAQAVVPDNGSINYTWWFQPEGCDKEYNCAGGKHAYEPGETISISDYERLDTSSKAYFTEVLDDNNAIIAYTMSQNEAKYGSYGSFGDIFKLYSLVEDDEYEPQDTYFINENEDEILDTPTTDENGNEIINYKKELYIKDDSSPDAFKKYNGESNLKDLPKYEKFMILKTPGDKNIDIIGEYSITAVNTKPGRHSETGSLITQESAVVKSHGCTVKGPIDIKFKTNIDDINFIRDLRILESGETLTEDDYNNLLNSLEFEEDKEKLAYGTTDTTEKNIIYDPDSKIYTVRAQITNLRIKYKELKIDLEETTGDLSYEWYKGDQKTNVKTLIADSSKDTLIATEPGWYKTKVFAKKNRRINSKESDPFRAVFMPRPFKLSINKAQSSDFSDPYYGIYQFDTDDETVKVKLAVDASLIVDNEEKFNTSTQTGSDLWTDKIEYKWYKYVENGGQDELTLKDLAEGSEASLNSPCITVYPNKNTEYFYKCIAINHLGDQVSSNSNAIVFSVAYYKES